MHHATRAWLDGLRDSVATVRRSPADEIDVAAAAAERMILATHFATWLDDVAALDEARRDHAIGTTGADPHPAIVVTTSVAGIDVVEDLLTANSPIAIDVRPRVAAVTEKDYRAWCMRHPDEHHLLHVNHWSWVKTRVPSVRDAEFAAHPRRDGEAYWLHRTGTAGAGRADGRATHLWKFTGRHATLLEPFIAEGRVPPPPGWRAADCG